jgi:hypothetical protein
MTYNKLHANGQCPICKVGKGFSYASLPPLPPFSVGLPKSWYGSLRSRGICVPHENWSIGVLTIYSCEWNLC